MQSRAKLCAAFIAIYILYIVYQRIEGLQAKNMFADPQVYRA